MSDDLTIPSRVPGITEIVGLVAGALPFVMSSASSSTTTINGEVVSRVYRDNVAIGGGAVALVCCVLSLLLLRRASNKPARLGLAAGLLALGALQLARGFGVM